MIHTDRLAREIKERRKIVKIINDKNKTVDFENLEKGKSISMSINTLVTIKVYINGKVDEDDEINIKHDLETVIIGNEMKLEKIELKSERI